MFNAALGTLRLCSGAANTYFNNIPVHMYKGDVSLTATLRYLLCDRFSRDGIFHTEVTESYLRKSRIEAHMSADPYAVLRSAIGSAVYKNSLRIVCMTGEKDDNDAFFRLCDQKLIQWYHDYLEGYTFREIADLKEYSRLKGIDLRVYVEDEQKCAIIVMSCSNLRNYHFIQSLLPRILPWYFKDKPITEKELELLQSLQKKFSPTYETLIDSFVNDIDLRAYIIRTMITDFEKKAFEAKKQCAVRELKDIQQAIEDNVQAYSEMIKRQYTLNIILTGMNSMESDIGDSSELAEYFITHKFIDPVGVDGRRFSFIVKTYLDSFDPDMYEVLSKNLHSYLYGDCGISSGVFVDAAQRKKLLDALFSDEATMRVKMCAYYCIDLNGEVSTYQYYDFPADCHDYLPNPHLFYHNCLGNHKRYIEERLRDNDIIGAIEQCVASAKSVNLGEGITFTKFLYDLFSTNVKCIELQSGRSVSPSEAVSLL